jgi:hypothetical protein
MEPILKIFYDARAGAGPLFGRERIHDPLVITFLTQPFSA